MKAILLAGGMGSRLDEETQMKPKPMVEIAGRPILWHIMMHLHHHGVREFGIALGYRGDMVKRYFLDPTNFYGDITVEVQSGASIPRVGPDWRVDLVDTGAFTNTAARVRRVMQSYPMPSLFLVTYGDGVSDVDVGQLLEAHVALRNKALANGGLPLLATVTAVHPPGRFGALRVEGDLVKSFREKQDDSLVNGGFILLEPEALKHPALRDASEDVDFSHVLGVFAETSQLGVYRHDGFWQCMDTIREKRLLEKLWSEGKAPWKVWE